MQLCHTNKKKWPALLTGTIVPNPKAISKVNDPAVREKQYIETLSWMAKAKTDVDEVIFCENSHSSLINFKPLHDMFLKNNRTIEVYNVSMPDSQCFFGKGWGEGLIIRWALENVLYPSRCDGFIKITGRYRILNLKRIMTTIRRGISVNPNLKFVGYSFSNRQPFHVRSDFFWSNRDFYIKYLQSIYEEVNDEHGYYLEHALANRLWQLKDEFDIAMLTIPLIIQGISGWNAKYMTSSRHIMQEELIQLLSPLPLLEKLTGDFIYEIK